MTDITTKSITSKVTAIVVLDKLKSITSKPITVTSEKTENLF